MRPNVRRGIRFALAAAAGSAVAALPAVAGSETAPSITAQNSTGLYNEQVHSWVPRETSVKAGGTVDIANPTTVPHGVEWHSGPETPACSAGVPVGTSEAASGTKWSGSCTFAVAGTYVFWCTIHHSAMQERITVSAEGTTTTTTTTTTPTSTSPPTTTTTTTQTSPQTGTSEGPSNPSPSNLSLLAGTAANAVKLLARAPHASLSGSIDVSAEGAGGRLLARALLARGTLGRRHGPARVPVGRAVLDALPAGLDRFTLTLDAAARRALRAHGHLHVLVTLLLTPPHGAPLSLTRSVTLHG